MTIVIDQAWVAFFIRMLQIMGIFYGLHIAGSIFNFFYSLRTPHKPIRSTRRG